VAPSQPLTRIHVFPDLKNELDEARFATFDGQNCPKTDERMDEAGRKNGDPNVVREVLEFYLCHSEQKDVMKYDIRNS